MSRYLGLFVLLFCGHLCGCYQSHGRDDAGADATGLCPPGTYTVAVRYEAISPAGCFTSMPGTLPIRVPLLAEDFTGMCGAMPGAVVETGACQWTIDTECLIPDASSTVMGVVTARGGVVRGRLSVTQSGFVGTCRFDVVLGD